MKPEDIAKVLAALTQQTQPAPVDLRRLAEPFPVDAVSWRVGSTTGDKTKGMALAYIDARDVMDRLDAVVGPANWRDEYTEIGGFFICKLWVRAEGEWVWKCDGAGKTDVEGEKGMVSDAFKRAAVKWGIGRYLYNLDSPWVKIEARGKSFVIADEGKAALRSVLMKHARSVCPNQEAGPAPEPAKPSLSPPQPKEAPTEPASSTGDNAPSKAAGSVTPASPRKTAADVPTVAPGGNRADDWKAREREKLEKRTATEKRMSDIKADGSKEVRDNLKFHLDKIKPGHPDARKQLNEWLSLAACAKVNMTQADQVGITGDYNLKLATIGKAERMRLEAKPPKAEEDFDDETGELREAAE